MNNPLKNIKYISIPDTLRNTLSDVYFDPSIPFPVEIPEDNELYILENLSWEMIISSMLKILSYNPEHKNADYYRKFIMAVQPDIVKEFTSCGIMKAKNKDFPTAEEIFLALANLSPDDENCLINLASVYEEQASYHMDNGNNELSEFYTAKAFNIYKSMLSRKPDSSKSQYFSGYFFLKQKNFKKAVKHFELFKKLSQDKNKIKEVDKIIRNIESQDLLDNLFKEAYDFIRLGDEETGIEKIRIFIDRHPEVWNGWFILGWGLRRIGKYGEAEEAFKNAIAKGCSEVDVYNEMAICLMELEKYNESKKFLVKALRIEPENSKIISNLGVLELKQGNKDAAAGYFKTVLEFSPDDPIASKYKALL